MEGNNAIAKIDNRIREAEAALWGAGSIADNNGLPNLKNKIDMIRRDLVNLHDAEILNK